MPLLDQHGRPIDLGQLTEELAAPVSFIRPIWHDPVADSLTPSRLAGIMSAAKLGDILAFLTLAMEMEEREAHYGSVLSTRKLAIMGLTPTVIPGGDDAWAMRIAQALEEIVESDMFGDLVASCTDAIAKGYSVTEIMWDRSGKQWWPKAFEWRDQRHFLFNLPENEELLLRSDANSFRGEPLAPFKFVVHYPQRKFGLKIAGGVARLAATSYMCKAYTLKGWMRFAELYGMPVRIGRYGPGAKPDQIDVLKRAVVNLGSDAAAVLPKSMQIDFEEPRGGTNSGETIYARLAEFWDQQTSKAVLGQTMTADSGSSRSQAEVHDGVRHDILRADAAAIARTIGKDFVRAFVDLNFGPQDRYPKIDFPVEDASDIAAISQALGVMVPLGLRVPQNWARKMIGAPAPDKDEEVLAIPSQPTTASDKSLNRVNRPDWDLAAIQKNMAAQAAAKAGHVHDDEDEIDRLVASELNEWEPQMREIVDPVQQALAAAQDFDDFKRRLATLADQIDPLTLQERLAVAFFKARGLGDAIDKP